MKKINFLIFFSFICCQAEFQISTIPENAIMVSSHKGLSGLKIQNIISDNIDFDFINFPANINYANLKYKNYSLSILDYGTLEDKIDNNTIHTFNAYELKLNYYLKKNLFNKFLLQSSVGIIYSQIDNYNSSAFSSNNKFSTQLKTHNIHLALAINNLGIVTDSYTSIKQKLPLQYQFGITHNVNTTNMILGYDLIYHTNIKKNEHILCMQLAIIESINFRISASNFRNNLLTGDIKRDWFYGFGYGLSINSDKIISDIGVSSLGDAGFVYAISIDYKVN